MNDKGLIRRFITMAVILLVAIFVVTQLYWSASSDLPQQASSGSPVASEARKNTPKKLNSRDLRSGGIARANRSVVTKPVSLARRSLQSNTATSTAFQFASSTPFNKTGSGRSKYRGVSVEFEPLPSSSKNKGSGEAVSVKARVAPRAVDLPGDAHPREPGVHKIGGRVLDDNGEPIEGLRLSLKLKRASAENTAAFGGVKLNTETDAGGVYGFSKLVAGEYILCTVEALGYKAVCQNRHAPHSTADFSLRSTQGGSVAGIVKDQAGEPMAEVKVSATPGQSQRAQTDSKGQYTLKMMVNSELNYQLYFTLPDYAQQRIVLKGADILQGAKLDVELKKTKLSGFDVSGTIYDQTGEPMSGRTVSLHSPSIKKSQALRAVSDKNGEFTIKYVQPGDDYRLSVNTSGTHIFDASSYKKMEVYEGMAPLNLQMERVGQGSVAARVVTTNGSPVSGENFVLYSGAVYVGQAVSDRGGEISFENVPVMPGGGSLRLSGGAAPKYSFSGLKLLEGEHKSGIELLVDRGDNRLELTVKDEKQQPLQGAKGVLVWAKSENGILSQTIRSRGKISMADTGTINFSELGPGEHRLQVRLKGYLPMTQTIDITQHNQQVEVVLVKAEKK